MRALAFTPLILTLLCPCTARLCEGGLRPLDEVSIIREGKSWNSETEILEVDGRRIGDFRLAVEMLPGTHEIRLRHFRASMLVDHIGDPLTVYLTTEPGHTYEVRGEPRLTGPRWRPEVLDITESLASPPPAAASPALIGLRFLGSRALDLLDIGQANATAGLGTLISIHPTRLLQIGLGGFTGARAGWMGRRFPFKFDSESSAGFSVLVYSARRPRDFWRIGAALHLLIVGAEVGVDPLELGDFFAGLAGADPLNDDIGAALPGVNMLVGD